MFPPKVFDAFWPANDQLSAYLVMNAATRAERPL